MASLMAKISGVLVKRMVQPIFQPDVPIQKQRQRLDFIQKFAPLPMGVKKQSITLAGLRTWRLTPTASASDKQLLYLHGGGYVSGSLQSHADLAARLAKATGMTANLIDYRLAPDHPFPAGLNDALAAYKALIQQGPVCIAGDSAGGGLTLALMQQIREQQLPEPNALVLFSPWTDLACQGDSFQTRTTREKLLSPEWIQAMVPAYIGQEAVSNPLISPLHADFRDFPATLIQVGSEEILYSDSTRLYEQMQQAQVKVSMREYQDMWHVFQAHAGYMPESKQALEDVASFLRQIKTSAA